MLQPFWHKSICLLLLSCLYIVMSRKTPTGHAKSGGKKCALHHTLLKMVTNIKIKGIRHYIGRHCTVQPPIMVLLMQWDLFWVYVLWTQCLQEQHFLIARLGRKNLLSLTCKIIKQVLSLIYCCHPHFSFFLFFNWQIDLSAEHETCNSF